jgi:hypothetical protein
MPKKSVTTQPPFGFVQRQHLAFDSESRNRGLANDEFTIARRNVVRAVGDFASEHSATTLEPEYVGNSHLEIAMGSFLLWHFSSFIPGPASYGDAA